MVSATGRVQLADFGIASIIDDPKVSSSGQLAGSPSYMAPEQAQNRPADRRHRPVGPGRHPVLRRRGVAAVREGRRHRHADLGGHRRAAGDRAGHAAGAAPPGPAAQEPRRPVRRWRRPGAGWPRSSVVRSHPVRPTAHPPCATTPRPWPLRWPPPAPPDQVRRGPEVEASDSQPVEPAPAAPARVASAAAAAPAATAVPAIGPGRTRHPSPRPDRPGRSPVHRRRSQHRPLPHRPLPRRPLPRRPRRRRPAPPGDPDSTSGGGRSPPVRLADPVDRGARRRGRRGRARRVAGHSERRRPRHRHRPVARDDGRRPDRRHRVGRRRPARRTRPPPPIPPRLRPRRGRPPRPEPKGSPGTGCRTRTRPPATRSPILRVGRSPPMARSPTSATRDRPPTCGSTSPPSRGRHRSRRGSTSRPASRPRTPTTSASGIEPTTFKGFDAAIWEFTYTGLGTDLHAADLGFVTGSHGFALNFQTRAEDWDGMQDVFESFQAAFQPPEG